MKYKMDASLLISIIGTVFAGFAVLFSWYAMWKTDKQFINLNQSYFDYKPGVNVVQLEGKEVIQSFPDTLMLDGLTFYCTLINVGNLPAKYVLRKCDILVDGQLKWSLPTDKPGANGIVYPKASGDISFTTIPFIPQWNFKKVRESKFRCQVKIEYWDLANDDQVKTIDRVYDLLLNNLGQLSIYWPGINDSVSK